MPWFGVVLRRWSTADRTAWSSTRSERFCCAEFCVQFDRKRRSWELPKGGAMIVQPRRLIRWQGRRELLVYDSSPFATARCELWEETLVWLAWRPRGTCTWVSAAGQVLPEGPSADQRAWVCTDLAPNDTYDTNLPPDWMTVREFQREPNQQDHSMALQAVQHLQHGFQRG